REQEASRRDFTKTTALEELDQLVGPVVVVVDMRRLPEDLLGAAEPRAVSVWKVDDRGATGFQDPVHLLERREHVGDVPEGREAHNPRELAIVERHFPGVTDVKVDVGDLLGGGPGPGAIDRDIG